LNNLITISTVSANALTGKSVSFLCAVDLGVNTQAIERRYDGYIKFPSMEGWIMRSMRRGGFLLLSFLWVYPVELAKPPTKLDSIGQAKKMKR
jgi:hypothetical protein